MTTPSTKESKEIPAPHPPHVRETKPAGLHRRRRMWMALFIPTFLLLVNAFVCASLSHFLNIPGWSRWQILTGFVSLLFVAVTFLGYRYSHPVLRSLYGLTATWLGLLNYLFFAAVTCWILAFPDWLAGWPLPRFTLGATLFSLAAVTSIYGVIRAARIHITSVDIHLPNLPEAWKGRTLALLTDLHLGHRAGPKFLERILSRLRTLKPDAVLISGDLFDGTTVDLPGLVAPWQDYSSPLGIYYVTGNHDEFADREIYLKAARDSGIRILNNEKVTIDDLQIVGVHDAEATDPTLLRSILRNADLDSSRPSLLLAHQPANLGVAEEEGISLQLSGHTHQGQFWPWTLVVSRVYGAYAYGLHRLQSLQVYTSSGVGTWGPPLRVGTKSEIVLIRLN